MEPLRKFHRTHGVPLRDFHRSRLSDHFLGRTWNFHLPNPRYATNVKKLKIGKKPKNENFLKMLKKLTNGRIWKNGRTENEMTCKMVLVEIKNQINVPRRSIRVAG